MIEPKYCECNVLGCRGEDSFLPIAETSGGVTPDKAIKVTFHDSVLCIMLAVGTLDAGWSAAGLPLDNGRLYFGP